MFFVAHTVITEVTWTPPGQNQIRSSLIPKAEPSVTLDHSIPAVPAAATGGAKALVHLIQVVYLKFIHVSQKYKHLNNISLLLQVAVLFKTESTCRNRTTFHGCRVSVYEANTVFLILHCTDRPRGGAVLPQLMRSPLPQLPNAAHFNLVCLSVTLIFFFC